MINNGGYSSSEVKSKSPCLRHLIDKRYPSFCFLCNTQPMYKVCSHDLVAVIQYTVQTWKNVITPLTT